MILYTNKLIFPDGETQEIEHTLNINQIVDLNGYPLTLPLPTPKMIAYRVCRISTQSNRGEEIRNFHLELMTRDDLTHCTRRQVNSSFF
ncbi:MAG: hypothetical protein JXR70_12065 [Spirochaetales bacterium]|nr:hypothetical protein [Spirochaetales bacterium]